MKEIFDEYGDFEVYNMMCSECEKHNDCHKDERINWDEVENCAEKFYEQSN